MHCRFSLVCAFLSLISLSISNLPQLAADAVGTLSVGGPTSPDGKTEVTCDLPVELRQKNIGGTDGAGLCVFTSIEHAARFQNEQRLWNFQKDMSHERGGGYPQKVDAMIAKYGTSYALANGVPCSKHDPGAIATHARYVQFEGGDPSILKAAIATGRMPGVTYNGHDPHYRGTIAHMVSLIYLDDAQACILDNNFINADSLVWMSYQDFLARWKGNSGGWAVVLLAPPPPPPPKN